MSAATQTLDCEVLIVGAGPVGLTLALALQRSGIRIRIVEQMAGFSGQSKAITVQPRTLEQLHLLGAAEPLIESGVRAAQMHMHDGRQLMTTLRYDWLPTAFPYYLHLHQGQTEQLLDTLLTERGHSVERGLRLQNYDVHAALGGDDAASCVQAHLLDADGVSTTVRCQYLVGCDGGHSRVRTGLGVSFSGERHGDNWIMADVKIAGFDLAHDQRHGFMLETYPFVILPMRDGYYRVIAARTEDSPLRGQSPSLEEFAQIADRLGFGHWRFEDPLWLTDYNPSQFIASDFRRGPVFIAGDAAHVNTPIAAQGLNTGVMDAVNLAWKLTWALRHGAGDRLLDSYRDERHPIVLGMFRENNRLTRMVFGRNRLLRTAIRKQLRMLRLRRLNLKNTGGSSQISVAYRNSPITLPSSEGGPSLLAKFGKRGVSSGERVPCPKLPEACGTASHLYDLLEPDRHTLLVFEDGDPAAAMLARDIADQNADWLQVLRFNANQGDEGKNSYGDQENIVVNAFGMRSKCAVLVRPDAFVAVKMTRLEEVKAKIDEYKRLLCG